MRPTELATSREFRDHCFQELPALQHRPFARLFAWLALGTWQCEETQKLLIPRDLLAILAERDGSSRFTGNAFLQSFCQDVAPLDWSRWNGARGRCRVVEATHFPPSMEQAIEMERSLYLPDKDLVYFLDGRPYTAKRRRSMREYYQSHALALAENARCEDARRLARYLNHVSPNRFTTVLGNMEHAIRVARALPDERKRKHALNTLKAIRSQPVPYYQPSPRGRTVRLFGYTASMLGLKKEVRHALTPDWVELDLKSSQASIIAKDWDIPSLRDFLARGGSIWDYLLTGLRLPQIDDTQAAMKTGFYSTVFGMREHSIKWTVSNELGEWGIGGRMLELPLMRDILAARAREMERVERAGGDEDCYKNQLVLDEDCNAKSVLAQCAQAREMQLLSPVIEMAERERGRASGFSIVLWQHDGFSMVPHKQEDREHWVRRLQEAVGEKAREMGYETRLVLA